MSAGNKQALVLAEIYEGAAVKQDPDGVVRAKINMKRVDSDDPLAYSMGFMHGASGQACGDGQDRADLAPEYVRGYRDGVAQRVR